MYRSWPSAPSPSGGEKRMALTGQRLWQPRQAARFPGFQTGQRAAALTRIQSIALQYGARHLGLR